MRDGEIVQLGTPEEIVANPADEYVRDFVRDVPREQVISVRRAMRPAEKSDGDRGEELSPDTLVSDAIEAVARSGENLRVVDDGRTIGVVDHACLLNVVAGLDDDESGDGEADMDKEVAAV
jgi:glycine betaine/proline transport system ATP-binding protein